MITLEVNGILIHPEAIRAESARLREQAREMGRAITVDDALELLAQAEEVLIERALLESEALRLGLSVEPAEVDRALARLLPAGHLNTACRTDVATADVRADVERRIRIDKLIDRWTMNLKPPPAKAIRKAYSEHRSEYAAPESVVVAQIVKNVHHADERDAARETMDRIARELDAGADFSALAEIYSDCPEQRGALGVISRGETVPEFEESVFHLALNCPSPVFETRFGFHIAKVTQRRAAGLLEFSEAAPHIAEALMRQARERELDARFEALRSRALIRRLKT